MTDELVVISAKGQFISQNEILDAIFSIRRELIAMQQTWQSLFNSFQIQDKCNSQSDQK